MTQSKNSLHNPHYAVNAHSLQRLGEVLPEGWSVESHHPVGPGWWSPHSGHVVVVSNGRHRVLFPDNETTTAPQFSYDDSIVPHSQNPFYTHWNPEVHGATIRKILQGISDRGSSSHSTTIMAPYTPDERQLPPDALGYTHENLGNTTVIRSPLSFMKHFFETIHSAPFSHERVQRLLNGSGLEHYTDSIQSARDIDDLEPSLFRKLNQVVFGSGPSRHSDENHVGSFQGHQPEGTHLMGSDAIDDTLRHEEGHTHFYQMFNRDLPDRSSSFPEDSPYSIRDLLDVLSKHVERWSGIKNGTRTELEQRVGRSTLIDPHTGEVGPMFPLGHYVLKNTNTGLNSRPGNLFEGVDGDSLFRDYEASKGRYLRGNMRTLLDEPHKLPQYSLPLAFTIAACAPSAKGMENLQELYATHYANFTNRCGDVDDLTLALAHKFNWPDVYHRAWSGPKP